MVSDALLGPIPNQGPVVFRAPAEGWSREAYLEAVQAFVRARGRAPQTITMHPDTFAAAMREAAMREAGRAAETLADAVRWGEAAVERVTEEVVEPALGQVGHGLRIFTSREHDRETIVME